MPKRTIGLETIQVRPGHNRKKNFLNLSDLEGVELLHVFHGWAASIPPDDLVDHQRGRYTKIAKVTPTGRSVLVEIEAGYFGTAGQTFDVATHAVSHSRSAQESATVMTRLLFTVAPGSTIGVFTSEREGLNGAGSTLVKRFRHDLVSHFPGYSFDVETVVESAAWAQGAELLAVTAVAYSVPVDLAKGVIAQPQVLGQMEQRLEPMKGQKVLPAAMLSALQKGTIKASDFLGFSDGQKIDDTFVTVSRDGRQKTYALDKERVPSVRVVVSDDGAPPLTPTPFIRKCQDEVRDYYEGMGLSWNDSWRSGTWAPESLVVVMPPRT
ncbi:MULTISPECIES: hypothetical protein [unclassified Rathayibacter]|uniref:hypothetical protein n=1 Tax=unclassified Rathayibacter TaxID=2609250 RepID=UPI000F91503D|nr:MULTISPECIES: hypothetical protein [unclassified Rathayibacter]ROP49790.1 hypothetical protein EDF45_2348 [Rathayibacter sp. PhB186]ROS51716.1 hypothetical protein EDF44_2051 [Rathayibacter sp. PhB185]